MILLDVNVLLAAHREDHVHHGRVRPWFDEVLDGDEAISIPDVVWGSFVRVATNRRIFEVPTPLEEAFAFVRAVRGQPNYATMVPGERHLELFEELCLQTESAGDLTADAYLAALALEFDCELVSIDRDFARFPGLRWRLPGA